MTLSALVAAARETITETYAEWRMDRTLRLGAGLAYYALFTIVPFLALTAALAGQIFGLIEVEEFLTERVGQMGVVEPELAAQSIADELQRRSVQSSLGIVGAGSLLFASSLVFLALVDAVNTIWHVPVRVGFGNSIRRRLLSFLMVLVTGSVLVAALAISAVSGAAARLVPGDVPVLDSVATLVTSLASGSALVVVLTLLFRYLGPVRAPWLAGVVSALTTTAMLVIGTEAIGWYLRNIGGSSLSGAFGAVLVVLSWVYYESQIVLAGVQFAKVLTRRSGVPVEPLLSGPLD
jgi:membrane protein